MTGESIKKEFHFLVQGSEPDPYDVVFKFDGKNLSARCTCPSGTHGKHCKHHTNLMVEPENSSVFKEFKPKEKEKIKILQEMLPNTDLWSTLHEFLSATEAFKKAKKAEKRAREAFKKKMNNY